jgi:hypothetical protein
MSTSWAPKHKEQEHMPPDEVEDFCNEILKAGMHLISVSGANFPNTELISNALGGVLHVVRMYNLEGKWVTSRVSNAEFLMTNEICSVSISAFSFLINVMSDL